MIAEKRESSVQEKEESFLHEVEMATLRRLAEIGFADQGELGEFYERFQSEPHHAKSDILLHLLLARQLDVSASDEIARKLMVSEERLMRCDFVHKEFVMPSLSRDWLSHFRLSEQMGARVLLAENAHLLIAGFNPIGICRLKKRLEKVPLSSRVLPYVSVMWLSAGVYQDRGYASSLKNGSGSRI